MLVAEDIVELGAPGRAVVVPVVLVLLPESEPLPLLLLLLEPLLVDWPGAMLAVACLARLTKLSSERVLLAAGLYRT